MKKPDIGIKKIILFVVLLAFSCVSMHANCKGLQEKSLSVTITSSVTWRWVSIRTNQPVEINQIPSKFGMWFTPEPDFALKPHVVFEDAQGEIFHYVYKMGFRGVPDLGGYFETTIANPKLIDKKKTSGGNGEIDAPLKFIGLDIPNRYPVHDKTVIMDNFTIDGKLVEDFEKDRKWYLADTGGAEKAKLTLTVSPHAMQLVATNRVKWLFPGNLIYNSSFEEDANGDGLPDGWETVSEDNIPRGADNKPLFSPISLEGIHRWEPDGLGSRRSMSFQVSDEKWYGWRTTVEKIRPNTTYSLILWYKQPRPNAMHVVAFGKIHNLKDMFEENSDHWVRASLLVNSGSDTGHGEINIICRGSGKFWLDQVELYEGTSGIGYERARMTLHYYYDMDISPDIISPLSFGYEHLFRPETAPEFLEFVLDLPSEVDGAGYWAAIPWGDCTSQTTLTKQDIMRNGKSFRRYIIRMPFSARGGYKSFTFPVGYQDGSLIRDRWYKYGTVGNYSGYTSLRWFLRTKETQGQFYGYYFVRWPDIWGKVAGQQPEREFRMNVVRISEVSRPKRFLIALDLKGREFIFRPDWEKDFRHLGVKRFGGSVPEDKTWSKKISEAANRSGYDGVWPWTLLTMDYAKYPDSRGTGMDGKRTGAYCLSYRGEGYQDFVERLKRYVDGGIYQVILNDEVSWKSFDSGSSEYFKKVFKKIYPNETYVKPIEFEKEPQKFPKHHTVWNDYFGGMYAQAILDVKKEIETYMRFKGINKKFRFSASSTGLFMLKIKIPEAIQPAPSVIEEVLTQPYIYYGARRFKGNPKRVGDAIAKAVNASKRVSIKTIPLISPGLGFTNPSCQLDPRSQMKYQILEGALAGMDGYQVYSGNDVDLADMRHMALANRLVVKYEDIILDGKPADDVVFASAVPKELKMLRSLRARRLGDRTLIWVADYSTYQPIPTEMSIKMSVNKDMAVIDAESGDEVAKLTPRLNVFSVKLKEERGRLLLVKPAKVSHSK